MHVLMSSLLFKGRVADLCHDTGDGQFNVRASFMTSRRSQAR